jgi:UDP-3-O-[3-hydroxymyristoyl] glucosamine N-acyltransferase
MGTGRSATLGELAAHIGARLVGDAALTVDRVASLEWAEPGALSFLSSKRFRKFLETTRAGAVILGPADAALCPVSALVCDEPYLGYARAAWLLYPEPEFAGGLHHSAVVDPLARVHPTAWVGPGAVLEAGVRIGPRVFVGPGCVIGRDCEVGEGSRLVARVTLGHGTLVGRDALLHPGAVVGSDGFGFARAEDGWLRIPQIGRVRLGDGVEVGANTTVDRGALGDTVIGAGVILDNQIQVGHNVQIGDNTAVAACTGISGSTRIGSNCLIGGDVGMAGHLVIGDGVSIAAGAKVTRDLPGPGNYGGVLPVDPDPLWRRNVARVRQLDALARRLIRIEKRVSNGAGEPGEASG